MPTDPRHWFRSDGRALGWKEYLFSDIDRPLVMSGWDEAGNFSDGSLQPNGTEINVSSSDPNDMVRFMFSLICPHISRKPNRREPYLPFLGVNPPNGKEKQRPFQTDGFWYWIDVPRRDLGAPGEQGQLLYMTKTNGKDARGLTPEGYQDFMSSWGAKSWEWGVLARWDIK